MEGNESLYMDSLLLEISYILRTCMSWQRKGSEVKVKVKEKKHTSMRQQSCGKQPGTVEAYTGSLPNQQQAKTAIKGINTLYCEFNTPLINFLMCQPKMVPISLPSMQSIVQKGSLFELCSSLTPILFLRCQMIALISNLIYNSLCAIISHILTQYLEIKPIRTWNIYIGYCQIPTAELYAHQNIFKRKKFKDHLDILFKTLQHLYPVFFFQLTRLQKIYHCTDHNQAKEKERKIGAEIFRLCKE